jgi:hypothetical protein
MCGVVRGSGALKPESWFSVVICVMVHIVFVIVFNVRFMESCDTMFPHVGIPYSRWFNLGGVILYPGVVELDGLMVFVGVLIRFDLRACLHCFL